MEIEELKEQEENQRPGERTRREPRPGLTQDDVGV